MEVYNRLLSEADKIEVIDTHEHLNPQKDYLGDEPDILCDYLSHYISSDLMAAGMPEAELQKARDPKPGIAERFGMLSPYLDRVRNGSYFRALQIAAERLYGVSDITRETIEGMDERFKKAVRAGDYAKYIMKDVCGIKVSLNDGWIDDIKAAKTDMFEPVWNFGHYFNPGFKPESPDLGTYCEAFAEKLKKQRDDGLRIFKVPFAYSRPIYFEDVDYKTADGAYRETLKDGGQFKKQTQDYIMHFALRFAEENGFAVQIHTGLQEGMRHNLEDSNPLLLKNLFAKYPGVAFDLFHTGYPYDREIIVLAKYHPNVYIDMCWAHIISPYASRKFLNEALDVVPYAKIFGFGGDYLFYDAIYGHLTLAKRDICEVLADKANRKDISVDLAERILRALLHDNAARVFNV